MSDLNQRPVVEIEGGPDAPGGYAIYDKGMGRVRLIDRGSTGGYASVIDIPLSAVANIGMVLLCLRDEEDGVALPDDPLEIIRMVRRGYDDLFPAQPSHERGTTREQLERIIREAHRAG